MDLNGRIASCKSLEGLSGEKCWVDKTVVVISDFLGKGCQVWQVRVGCLGDFVGFGCCCTGVVGPVEGEVVRCGPFRTDPYGEITSCES